MKRNNKTFGIAILICFFMLSSHLTIAQSGKSIDDRFKEARELAFSGKRLAAIDSLESILVDDPGYNDVRVFMARVLAWNKQYDESIKQLHIVLADNKKKRSALTTMIDVYTWNHNYEKALQYCNTALNYFAPYPELLLKKSKLLKDMGKHEDASLVISQMRDLFPSNKEAMAMERSLSETAILNKASLKYKISVFPSTEPWHIVWGEFSRRVKFGTLIFRLGYGYRFEQGAVAMEANGYINIRSGTYVHASFLFSGSTIFPRYAIGVEPYQSLPYGFEVSLGARYMDWTTSNLVIWTGSLGKYLSNFWLAYRFYYSAKAERSSFSSALYIRRYLTDTDNYLTLRLGLGLTDYNEIEDQELSGFNSRGAALEMQLAIIPLLYFKAEILYSNYEYYKGKFRDRYGLEIGIQKRF